MKKFFIFLTLTTLLVVSCKTRKIMGNVDQVYGSYFLSIPSGQKGRGLEIGDSVFVKHTFAGYSDQETDSLRYVATIEDSIPSVRFTARIGYGKHNVRFFSKNIIYSWDFLNPIGLSLIKTYDDGSQDSPIMLNHYRIIWTNHENGYPMAWGLTSEFESLVSSSGDAYIDPLEPTPMTEFTLSWNGIPDSTYINGILVAFPDSLLEECSEDIGNDGIWISSSYTSLTGTYFTANETNYQLHGIYPMNGYFSFNVQSEAGQDLYMGVYITTPYGSCECMNIHDYYEGEDHFIRFLVEFINGVPCNMEKIDYRIGNLINIGF